MEGCGADPGDDGEDCYAVISWWEGDWWVQEGVQGVVRCGWDGWCLGDGVVGDTGTRAGTLCGGVLVSVISGALSERAFVVPFSAQDSVNVGIGRS